MERTQCSIEGNKPINEECKIYRCMIYYKLYMKGRTIGIRRFLLYIHEMYVCVIDSSFEMSVGAKDKAKWLSMCLCSK